MYMYPTCILHESYMCMSRVPGVGEKTRDTTRELNDAKEMARKLQADVEDEQEMARKLQSEFDKRVQVHVT